MESLNHDMNDMDSLFRKAAENYSLKSGDDNWDKIFGKLFPKDQPILPIQKNRYRKYLGLFLSFLLSGAVFFYLGVQNGSQDQIVNVDRKTSPNRTITPGMKNDVGENALELKTTKSPATIKTAATVPHQTLAVTTNQNEIRTDINGADPYVGFENSSRGTVSPSSYPQTPKIFSGADLSVSRSVLKKDSIIASAYFEKQNKPDLTDPVFDSRKDNQKFPAIKSMKGFYLGLTVGPDFSKVKSQPIERSGYNLGLLAGYRFNRNISVESGIVWSRKKYYTAGEYFQMKGSSMPSNMKIITVDGQLTSFELPLKIKYDFLRKGKSNLFLSTGVLSNIYLKEKNNYLTEMNGVQEYQVGLYKDIFYSWLSLVNISGGYEHSFRNAGTVRLEPYIKIPLKKVGVGSLPVFSTGINVSFVNLFSSRNK